MTSGLRIAVAGATGTLGRELLSVLEARDLPVDRLVPIATDRSTGREVEFAGETLSVECELPQLAIFDLLIICTPPDVALDLVRAALRAEVGCIDCSGALADSSEVPFVVADLIPPSAVLGAPLVSAPAGPALAWALVLRAIEQAAGLRRVVGTVLQSVSSSGRDGIDALSGETLALLRQEEVPEPSAFPVQIAFDCVPTVGTRVPGEDTSSAESLLIRDLGRLLENLPKIALSALQVPTFVGDGSALTIETERPLSPEDAREVLDKAPGVEVWDADGIGPTTRDCAGRDQALVGRVRRDPSLASGLMLWLAADPVRLAAVNAVKLAEARLRLQ